jgi:hypothetical protein
MKIYTKFKFDWWFMLNKGSEYLFILSYGHLDLLTSMYSYQDATKENMNKSTWNLVKILITGTIFFYFTQLVIPLLCLINNKYG